MANTFEVVDWLTMEGMRRLKNKSQISQFFNTDYAAEYNKEFAVGETIRVPLPQRFLITNGLAYQDQPINRRHTTVTLDQVFGVHFQWDSVEKALKMGRSRDSIKREYLDPAVDQMAAEIDARCSLWAYQNTNNIAGVMGVVPTAVQTYGSMRTRMNENSCPEGKRGLIISPSMEETIVANTTTNFNPNKDISEEFREGSLGRFQGFDTYSSNQLYTHVAGTWAGAVTVTGANQSGTSFLITATAGDTFNVGDTVNVAGMNSANPVSRRTLGRLKQLVVTQALVAVGGGADVLNFSPEIFGPGSQYQNVDALPAALAAMTLTPGTAAPNGKSGIQGLALHRDAFGLVGVKLENPTACEFSSYTRDPATGLSMSFFRMMDPRTRTMLNRFDMGIGFGNFYPDNCAVRMESLT